MVVDLDAYWRNIFEVIKNTSNKCDSVTFSLYYFNKWIEGVKYKKWSLFNGKIREINYLRISN